MVAGKQRGQDLVLVAAAGQEKWQELTRVGSQKKWKELVLVEGTGNVGSSAEVAVTCNGGRSW